MALIVPGVARFTLNQTYMGNNVANVLDYQIDTTGSTMSREDAVAAQAQDLAAAWQVRIEPIISDELILTSVTWVDLDEADGSTGTFTSGGGVTLPSEGNVASAPFPGNVSLLVRKQIQGNRARRSGRMYLCGIAESFTAVDEPNIVDAANLATINSALAGFRDDTNNLDTLGTAFESFLSVVHVTARDSEGNPTAGVHSVVSSLAADPLLATQRRRLRR